MTAMSVFLGRFGDDTRGAIAAAFAISLMAMLFCAGLALDSSRVYDVSTKVQSALDAAALAGAKALDKEGATEAQIKATTKAFFDAHIPDIGMNALTFAHFVAIPDYSTSTMKAQVDVSLPSIFGGLAGMSPKFSFTPVANASYKSKKVELTLVLDVTGSMNNPATKMAALKTAAKDLVDTLFESNPAKGAVRVALVPYSASVNAGTYANAVSGGASTDGCVVERDGADAFTDAPPGAGSYLGASNTTENPSYRCPVEPVTPLTDLSKAADRDAFKASIDAMSPLGATAGHIGAAWGWYMLSPEWSSFWPDGSKPRPYSPDVIKAVILMTDGMFNTAYRNGGLGLAMPTNEDPLTAGSSANQALQHCQAIRANDVLDKDIKVYTIAFQAPTSAENILQQCSGVANFYNTDTSAQLNQAFKDIVDRLTNLRITS